MTHLEVETRASDYLEGRLEAARRAPFEAHLAGCSQCRDLLADVRRVVELCHSAEDLEPAPWLMAKILRATIGERQPTLMDRLAAVFRPALQPRVAYGVAMAVFSFSIIINAAGINLRHMRLGDLNPRTWVYRANRTGHLLYARAEKFYYDLRVVYEIESWLRQRSQPNEQKEEEPKKDAPPGGSTDSKPPDNPELASVRNLMTADPNWVGTKRSLSR